MLFDCRLECGHVVKKELPSPPTSPSHLALDCPTCHGKFHVLEVTADLSKPVKTEVVHFPSGDVLTHTYAAADFDPLSIDTSGEPSVVEFGHDHEYAEPPKPGNEPKPGGHSGSD